MTVRKRLSRSHNLMIILPIVVSVLLTLGLMRIFNDRFGMNLPGDDAATFEEAVMQLQSFDDIWAEKNDFELIVEDLASFNALDAGSGASAFVYQGDRLLYSTKDLATAFAKDDFPGEEGSFGWNQEVYYQNSGDYTILLVNAYHRGQGGGGNGGLLIFWLMAILMIIAVVMIINRLLTRYVFRHIIDPLNTLVDGVHELRDGNLEYRILYRGKDEFSEVCNDFNEMAQQLSNLIRARSRDDENRRELIAGISHDLRTPLTSIKAYVEGIQQGVANTPDERAEYLDIIKAKADDLEHIVKQLFQYSKLDTGAFPFKMENIEIGEELGQYIHRVADEYERRGLTISLGENVRDALVMVDIVQLRAIFTNILENAVKYGADQDKRMLVQCRKQRGKVLLSFRDNGPGVNEEALDKLFNAFYRNDAARKNPGRGSGLGLAISAKIVERFGGAIEAQNAVGGGLCIQITLPIIRGNDV